MGTHADGMLQIGPQKIWKSSSMIIIFVPNLYPQTWYLLVAVVLVCVPLNLVLWPPLFLAKVPEQVFCLVNKLPSYSDYES